MFKKCMLVVACMGLCGLLTAADNATESMSLPDATTEIAVVKTETAPELVSETVEVSAIVSQDEKNPAVVEVKETAVVAQPVPPEPAPMPITVIPTKVQTFNHLHVFSIGGLLVLFCLFTGLSSGAVWFMIFAVFMSQWGWITLPDTLLWLQSPAMHKVILFLLILNIVFSSGIVIDIALLLVTVWIVINGVFAATPFLGRCIVLAGMMCFCTGGAIAVWMGSTAASVTGTGWSVKIGRVVAVFVSLWIMSIWL